MATIKNISYIITENMVLMARYSVNKGGGYLLYCKILYIAVRWLYP